MTCCLQYTPGVVLSLESPGPSPSRCPIFGLSEATGFLLSPGAGLVLRAYLVAPGDELRYSVELQRKKAVVATSLNYLGTLSATETEEGIETDPGRQFFEPRRGANWVDRNGATLRPAWDERGEVQGPPDLAPTSVKGLLVIADPDPVHCSELLTVARAALGDPTDEGFSKWGLDILAINLVTSGTAAVDLWALCCLLLSLCDVKQRIAAVNLSFDLGVVCGSKDHLPSPLGSYCYSFPLFEEVLDHFIANRRESKGDSPLVFAAAGNRRTNATLWRLAYPAVLPDVVAVTQSHSATQRNLLAGWVDLPAVGPLNPCFAEPHDGMQQHQGTSFACVAIASKFTHLDVTKDWGKDRLGQFEKLARLLGGLSSYGIQGNVAPEPWAPSMIFNFNARSVDPDSPSDSSFAFQRLLERLNKIVPGREFLLTGSAAFVAEWMSVNIPPECDLIRRKGEILGLIGDLDLVYAGPELDAKGQKKVTREAVRWIQEDAKFQKDWDRFVQLHHLRRWGSAIHLLQFVIPAASMFLTARGPINPWEVEEGLRGKVVLDFFPPDGRALEVNPQHLNGSSGYAHAALIWLNLNLIAARLKVSFLKEDPRLPESKMQWLIEKIRPGDKPHGSPESKPPFGHVTLGFADRTTKRITHTEELLRGFEGLMEWKPAVDLLDAIQSRWNEYKPKESRKIDSSISSELYARNFSSKLDQLLRFFFRGAKPGR